MLASIADITTARECENVKSPLIDFPPALKEKFLFISSYYSLNPKNYSFTSTSSGTHEFCSLFLDPPIVNLRLGSTLNPDDIKEGDDVYFECHVKANPPSRRLSWYHDVSTTIISFNYSNNFHIVINAYKEIVNRTFQGMIELFIIYEYLKNC